MTKWWWLLLISVGLFGTGLLIVIARQDQDTHAATLPAQPDRIVSLAPNLTEILFALGLGEKVVAVSSDSDFPPAAAEKTKVGTFWQPNLEAVIASKPDLVITLWFEQQRSVAESLKRAGYPVLTLKIEIIEELLTAIKEIGAAAGAQERADQLVANIVSRVDALQCELGSRPRVKVLWVVQTEPLRVAGRNTFINELIELAGGENAIGSTLSQYPQIGTEELLACGAEVIIQSAMGKTDIAGQQRTAQIFWNRWPSLPAVKDNKIHVVEPDTILRLGPRLCNGLEMIANCLHAERFGTGQNRKQQVMLTDD